jgi:hypothetical protein
MRRDFDDKDRRRYDRRQRRGSVKIALGQKGDGALMVRLVCIMVQMTMQFRGNRKHLHKDKQPQAKQRNRLFGGHFPRWTMRCHGARKHFQSTIGRNGLQGLSNYRSMGRNGLLLITSFALIK